MNFQSDLSCGLITAQGEMGLVSQAAAPTQKDNRTMTRVKIKPFLWFQSDAEKAAEKYCSLFRDSRIVDVAYYPEGAPAPAGSVMTVEFELAGLRMVGLNGGPAFQQTEAFSLSVECDSQDEVDHLWKELTADGGQPSQCGWLKDRWGLSWQITPRVLIELMCSREPGVAARVMAAMMQMGKIDIATLQSAAAGA